ncbi:MAG: repair protein SbcD/Mre11 [Acidimicrobiia bacterium]|jgi:hypothetical protein|nr:repair protein SbcD/Mre11 [Acidimicrobiia bacterium]
MPFRLLHTADLHLDAAFTGVGVTPPWVRHRLSSAGLDTVDHIVDAAIERHVDAVVVAGGMWTGSMPTVAARQRLRTALERLAGHGVQAVVTGGERDHLDVLLADWHPPPGVGVVPAGELRAGDLSRGSEVLAHVLVGSGRDAMDTLSRQQGEPDGLPVMGVCALPPPDPDGGRLPPLDGSPVVYWALGGRWPARADRLPRGAWVVMAGTPQLHRFPEPGTGAGVVLVDCSSGDGGPAMSQPTWIPMSAVELITVPVDLADAHRRADLTGQLDEVARRAAAALPGRLPVLRGILQGTGPLRSSLVNPETRASLLDEAREQADEWWWADLVLAPLSRQDASTRMGASPEGAALGGAAETVRGLGPEAGIAAAWDGGPTRPVSGVPPQPAWTGLTTEATSLALDVLHGLGEAAFPVDKSRDATAQGGASTGGPVGSEAPACV